ncbi:MAG: GH92 family glycosyl hydrolase [Microbacteriaceae bacterium]
MATRQRAASDRIRTKIAAGALAGGVVIAGAIVPAAGASAAETDYAALVNPFVGTESEGNAYPGATLPFGMVQLSPDNTNSYQSTSYSPEAGQVWGFSHRHVNSAGCPAAGELLVTPTTTEAPVTQREFLQIADQENSETAQAGYYGVTLENDVRAELTATERTGVHRYTFPATETANLSFNVGQTLRDAGASSVTWVDDSTLEGWVDNGGFCGGSDIASRYFFSASFDRPALETGVWGNDAEYVAGESSSESTLGDNGAVAVFDTTDDADVEVRVGVSYVDIDGARANLADELGDEPAGFDAVRERATAAWNEQLGVAEITASPEAQRIFYTQLYKSFLSPTIGSDVDGRYRGMDQEIHTADGWTYHQTFSLWDTYRTQAALHAILAKDTAQDIVRSMYQHRIEGGWLPRWSLGSIETNIMAGDPASAWVAENFATGTVPDDIADGLWAALIENATTPTPDSVASVGRQSADFWIENGHIPYYPENEPGLGQEFEEYRHGGSSSMEFAISDAAIGAAAQRLGKPEAAEFLDRGQNWQRLWNDDVELSGGFSGIVNAVTPEGEFVPADERAGVQESGFHEGTQWQYQWMANQDFAGLHEKMGGEQAFTDRLDYYFDMDALLAEPGVSPDHWATGGSDYYSSIGYNPGNEPTIMNPWLYSSVGQPAKVNDVLAANLNRFPDTPGGGVGNDDLGTMSSWYVMASLGFQSIVPGSGMLGLNAPRVEAATLTVGDGATLEISAPGANESLPSYVSALQVDGADHTATWLDVEELLDGGALAFTVADDSEGLTWGTAVADRLPSVADPLRVTPTIADAGAEFTTGEPATRDIATVAFDEVGAGSEPAAAALAVDAAQVPIAATLELDGEARDVTVRQSGDDWVVALEAEFADAGTLAGELTIVPAAETPRFAPAPFAAQSAPIEIVVAAVPTDPTDPGDPGVGDPGGDAGSGDGSGTAGGPLASTGTEALAPLIAAAVALLLGSAILVQRILRRRRQGEADSRA